MNAGTDKGQQHERGKKLLCATALPPYLIQTFRDILIIISMHFDLIEMAGRQCYDVDFGRRTSCVVLNRL